MTQFEYLSVLVSIIIGLGLSHLLSSIARLIQLRHRTRFYVPTLCWMALLFLAHIQIWWVAFERRGNADWNFFSFLLYLLIPITVFVLSYLIVPDLEREGQVDLKASYYANRVWVFGLFGLVPLISLGEEYIHDGGIPMDADVLFRLCFMVLALCAATIRSERYHAVNAGLGLSLFFLYIFALFLQLQ